MSDSKAPGVGDPAPDFTLKTIGLKDVSLKSFRGKRVVVLFYPLDWTPGCSTCMPAFDRRVRDFSLHKLHKGRRGLHIHLSASLCCLQVNSSSADRR